MAVFHLDSLKIITFRCCKGLFDTGNVKRALRTTFKRRPFNVRPFLLILISVLVILDVMHKGPGPIGLIFFRGVSEDCKIM